MGKQRVEMSRLSLDAACYSDLISGKGFLMTDSATFEWEGEKGRSMFGPQSPLFGTSITDEQELATRHRCKCGDFTGKIYKGETCVKCGGHVEFRGVNPSMTGWIPLGPHKIINPLYYNILASCIGGEVLKDIITCQQTVNRDGIRKKLTKEDLKSLSPTSPFHGIGLEEFRWRYYEILDWAEKRRPGKKETIQMLRHSSINVFTSYIQVYTNLLRQSSTSGDSYYYTGIDRHINTICNLTKSLADSQDIDRAMVLNRIQTRVNAMWEINFSELDGKDGFIRDQISGGSLNYSSRNVIIPDPTLRDNEVDLAYSTAHSLFRNQIIRCLTTMNSISVAKANEIWERGHIFDERIYQTILYIIEKDKPMVCINRNPTLNYYSIILMRVRGIINDKSTYVMSVPLSILAGLNADFDGDILNILAVVDPDLKRIFRKYDPIRYMITSRDDGYLNNYFSINKDQRINLYHFCTLK